MIRKFGITALWMMAGIVVGHAEVEVSMDTFGKSLGGWKKRGNQTAEYSLSGSMYRTYRPEVTTTPEGGIFVSVRLDHVRGWLSSDDHAMLEVTVNPQGIITSAKSNIAIQGRSIMSDVILGTNEAGKGISGANRAVQVGTDLVSDLTAKLLREDIVEAGRVSFPAAIRHNYNHLYQALVVNGVPASPVQSKIPLEKPVKAGDGSGDPAAVAEESVTGEGSAPEPPVAQPVPENVQLQVQPFPEVPAADMPASDGTEE